MSRNKTALRVKENNEKKKDMAGHSFFLILNPSSICIQQYHTIMKTFFFNRETREIVVSCQNAETKLLKNY